MLTTARRHLLVIALLLVGSAAVWGQRLLLRPRLPEIGGPTAAGTPGTGAETAGLPFLYFLDIEGWYRITPYEAVVRSPYDLTAETTEGMARALPATLGEWRQVGEDHDSSRDPAVVEYLRNPTVALSRTYQDRSGQQVTLGLVGNKGDDSFLLFSHTPETCYPGILWQVVEQRRESAAIDGRPVSAQYLLTRHLQTGQELMVLFFYLWDDPERDSRAGVLSVRLNLSVAPDQTEEAVLARAWSFLRILFPSTVPWNRF